MRDVNSVAEQIRSVEEQIIHLTSKLDSIRQQYLALLREYLPQRVEDETKAVVSMNPAETKKQSPEQLRQLKERTREAAKNVPGLVDEWIASDKFWPHLNGAIKGVASRQDFPRHNVSEDGLRRIVWLPYEILGPYGLGDKQLFIEGSRRNSYPYGIVLPDPIEQLKETYSRSCDELQSAMDALAHLKVEQQQVNVADEWEKL